jgi:hypothetical protein
MPNLAFNSNITIEIPQEDYFEISMRIYRMIRGCMTHEQLACMHRYIVLANRMYGHEIDTLRMHCMVNMRQKEIIDHRA